MCAWGAASVFDFAQIGKTYQQITCVHMFPDKYGNANMFQGPPSKQANSTTFVVLMQSCKCFVDVLALS